MEFFSKISEWLKLSPKYLVAILICCSILLFFPDSFLKELGIQNFKKEYNTWIGFIFLGTLSILFSHILFTVKKTIAFYYNINKYKKELKYLTPAEKEILRHYIDNELITEEYRFTNGVINALEMKLILVRSSSVSSMGDFFPYNIQPWAAKYLKKHPELIK